jgi:uncharacterized protein (TIGR00251 family)
MIHHLSDGVIQLDLMVQPGARKTEWVGVHGDAIRLKLSAPPVDGKANQALLRFLADSFDVPLRQVELKSGESSRRKRVLIRGSTVSPKSIIPL